MSHATATTAAINMSPTPAASLCHAAAATATPSSSFIMVQQPMAFDKEYYATRYPRKTMLCLSTIQFGIGSVVIVGQAIVIMTDLVTSRCFNFDLFGVLGIWCGIIFVLSGLFGILAAIRPSQCSIITSMVLSILTACFCTPFLAFGGFGVGLSVDRGSSNSCNAKIDVAMFSIQLLVALVQAVVSIIASSTGCRAVCCGSRTQVEGSIIHSAAVGDTSSQKQSIPLGEIKPTYITMPVQQLPPADGSMSTGVVVSGRHQGATPEFSSGQESPPPNCTDAAPPPPLETATKDESKTNASKHQRLS